MIDLDETDRRLLRLLAEDGALSAGAAGRKIGLSQPAAWRRIRRLTEAGILKGRRIDLDLEKAGFGVTVFLLCSIDFIDQTSFNGILPDIRIVDINRVSKVDFPPLPRHVCYRCGFQPL